MKNYILYDIVLNCDDGNVGDAENMRTVMNVSWHNII